MEQAVFLQRKIDCSCMIVIHKASFLAWHKGAGLKAQTPCRFVAKTWISVASGKKKLAYPMYGTNRQVFKTLKISYLVVALGAIPNCS